MYACALLISISPSFISVPSLLCLFCSFPSFKNILADETNGSGIPAVDQILLIGPTPFKRLDTNVGVT